MSPAKDGLIAIVSDPGIGREEFSNLLMKSHSLRVRLYFNYKDISGARYETFACLSRLSTGAISYCADEKSYIK